MKTETLPLWKNLLFHLIPGVIITALYLLLSSFLVSPVIPKALIFYISGLVLIPVVFIIMKKSSPTGKVNNVIGYREKSALWKMILLGLISFLWAALIMTVLKQLNNLIQNNIFGWMSSKFIISDYLINPDLYPKYMLIITWVVGLLTTSTILPVVEELYFRGYLLKELEKYKITAVILSALFFSLYHVFSPWMILARFIAILPMTFFVWKLRDIRIGILTHVLLNLVGDSLFTIPIIFGI